MKFSDNICITSLSCIKPVLVRKQDIPDSEPDWCKTSEELFVEFKVAAVGEEVPIEYLAQESERLQECSPLLAQCLQG